MICSADGWWATYAAPGRKTPTRRKVACWVARTIDPEDGSNVVERLSGAVTTGITSGTELVAADSITGFVGYEYTP